MDCGLRDLKRKGYACQSHPFNFPEEGQKSMNKIEAKLQ